MSINIEFSLTCNIKTTEDYNLKLIASSILFLASLAVSLMDSTAISHISLNKSLERIKIH